MSDKSAHTLGLVGDIGGTNARFALADLSGERPVIIEPQIYQCADFASIEEVAQTYLAGREYGAPTCAVLAVAGPVVDGCITFTNMNWSISEPGFSDAVNLQSTRLINDYTALALAAPLLLEEDAVPISRQGTLRADATVAIMGAGTGFGVSALVRDNGCEAILTTEGGHIAFAPTDAVEMEVWRILSGQFGRVSIERILSGPGLLNLYRALCQIEGHPAVHQSPTEITDAAAGGDAMAVLSVERFCAILGSVAGDFALTYGAFGGVFIAGGVAARFAHVLNSGGFRARFEAKGRFEGYLSGIATRLILHPHKAALLGAARALADRY